MSSSTSVSEVEPGLDGSTSPGTFVQLAEAEVAAAYRVAGFLLHDADEAQDATQEALLRAWRAWPRRRDCQAQGQAPGRLQGTVRSIVRGRLSRSARQSRYG